MAKIEHIDQADREHVDAFIVGQWMSLRMVVHGEDIDLGTAEGFYAQEDGEIIGLVTYRLIGDELEVLSLDSLHEGKGIGTALLDLTIAEAQAKGVRRVVLTTTNDNLHALRFYQMRGFDLVALRRNALDQARKIKPEIPLVGMDGIPLKHEIDLALTL